MANGRARRVRLTDVAGGRDGPGADAVEGQTALLLYVDAAGGVTAAAAGELGLHGLLARELEVYTLSDTEAAAGLVAAVRAATGQAAWAREPRWGRDRGDREQRALTARGEEVLRLVAQGLTNEAAAGALGISGRTVSYHLTRIYARLGVSGRGAAIAWAVRRGLG